MLTWDFFCQEKLSRENAMYKSLALGNNGKIAELCTECCWNSVGGNKKIVNQGFFIKTFFLFVSIADYCFSASVRVYLHSKVGYFFKNDTP